MTIKYLAANEIQGLSSDIKPTLVPTNSIFFETDTQSNYYWNGSSWVLITSGGGTGSTGVNFGSYTIYTDTNGAVKARNNFTGAVQYATVSAPATSAHTTSLLNTVYTQLNTIGGLVQYKRGVYPINGEVNLGISSSPLVNITSKGEGDNTVIQFDASATASRMFVSNCNTITERLRFDGNGVSHQMIYMGTPSYCTVQENHFMNAGGGGALNVQTDTPHPSGGGNKGVTVRNNWFDKTGADDQCAIGSDEYAIITGNFFDRRIAGIGASGSTGASCLTSGGCSDLIIRDNVFKRPLGDVVGLDISIEPYGTDYDRIIINGNSFLNGRLAIGGLTWTGSNAPTNYKNIVITNNTAKYATMWINGSPSDPGAGSIQNLIISDNGMSYAYWGCIMLSKISGPTLIRGNMLRDSNKSDGTGGDRGLIYVDHSNVTDVFNNFLHMTDNSTSNTSPFGIKSDAVNTFRAYDNNFVNPIGRPTLVGVGVSTGITSGNNLNV